MRAELLRIYNAYPRQVCRGEAIREIVIALQRIQNEGIKDPAKFLLEKVKEFAQSDVGQDRRRCPRMGLWLEREQYHDDTTEWSDHE